MMQDNTYMPDITILSIDPESKDHMPEGDYELLVNSLGQRLTPYALYYTENGMLDRVELHHPDLPDGHVILIDHSIKCKMKLTYQ